VCIITDAEKVVNHEGLHESFASYGRRS
jgi:hypothetical protein